MVPGRFENERLNMYGDGPLVKVLFALSCLLIGGVVLYLAFFLAITAVFSYEARNGVVRALAPVYAATDEQSLLRLEDAEMKGEDLLALAAASDRHIVLIASKTPVRYKGKSFYEGQKLSPKSNDSSARPVLCVTVLAGPEKGRTVWIAEHDVGFYTAL